MSSFSYKLMTFMDAGECVKFLINEGLLTLVNYASLNHILEMQKFFLCESPRSGSEGHTLKLA